MARGLAHKGRGDLARAGLSQATGFIRPQPVRAHYSGPTADRAVAIGTDRARCLLPKKFPSLLPTGERDAQRMHGRHPG
jgi:hypothetical protein